MYHMRIKVRSHSLSLQNSIYLDVGMLFVLAIGYRALGFAALLWKAKRKT
jgi:hypothetical protein